MPVKGPGGGKFTQFVSHHVLGHKYGQKFSAVVDRKCQAYKLRKDGGSPGPGPDDLSAHRLCRLLYLLQ